ncbi:hypothetical protein BDV34DRAFT_8233 [Aspergillus parasiticus]|uniref:Uncharacterized protein n=1 Tax=Aspergillus parasiticus TaxID=5067 RepID=A0A5N6DY62_ASPPA|nr:hypothetical protein BDV34DRAFT_8233 [Aspergillus parasiticus]
MEYYFAKKSYVLTCRPLQLQSKLKRPDPLTTPMHTGTKPLLGLVLSSRCRTYSEIKSNLNSIFRILVYKQDVQR